MALLVQKFCGEVFFLPEFGFPPSLGGGGGGKALVAGPLKENLLFFCGFPNKEIIFLSELFL